MDANTMSIIIQVLVNQMENLVMELNIMMLLHSTAGEVQDISVSLDLQNLHSLTIQRMLLKHVKLVKSSVVHVV